MRRCSDDAANRSYPNQRWSSRHASGCRHQAGLEDELRFDPTIDATDIAVVVHNGVVELTGFVHSYPEKIAAEGKAKRVPGVVGVANGIEVRLPVINERPDPELVRDAVAALKPAGATRSGDRSCPGPGNARMSSSSRRHRERYKENRVDPESIVFVVDDDASVREALNNLIRSVGLHVQSFATAQAFLDFERPDMPACLVLDVRLHGQSGLDLQRELARGVADPVPIVFITAHGDIPMSVRAMKAGAVEFLPKPFRDQDLLDAIAQALDRDRGARHERTELANIRHRYQQLTPRECEIATLIVEGLRNKQVAARLGVSDMTVKVHRRKILEKMGVRSLPQLTLLLTRIEAY